jgi:hypothetical protein
MRFEAKLSDLAPAPDARATRAAATAFEALLTRRWETDAMFLTFLETERLAADAAAALIIGHEDEEPSLEALEASFEALLDGQMTTMTVRGTVRDEFLESRGLSRT